MTTINTMQDLTRLLRENPEWRDEVRQLLLTQELLELPQRFAEYTKVTDKRLDSIEHKLDTLTENVNALTTRVDTLTENVNALTTRVDTLTENVNALTGTVNTLSGRVDSLRGYTLEQRLPTQLPPLASREFDVRRVYPIWASSGTLAANPRIQAFENTMERASEDGVITDDDETRLRVTDLILRSQRKADSSTLWFAVEASGVINYEDITRAKRSATAIAKIYDQDAVPLVYGYQIYDEQRELAAQLQVSVFLDPEEL